MVRFVGWWRRCAATGFVSPLAWRVPRHAVSRLSTQDALGTGPVRLRGVKGSSPFTSQIALRPNLEQGTHHPLVVVAEVRRNGFKSRYS